MNDAYGDSYWNFWRVICAICGRPVVFRPWYFHIRFVACVTMFVIIQRWLLACGFRGDPIVLFCTMLWCGTCYNQLVIFGRSWFLTRIINRYRVHRRRLLNREEMCRSTDEIVSVSQLLWRDTCPGCSSQSLVYAYDRVYEKPKATIIHFSSILQPPLMTRLQVFVQRDLCSGGDSSACNGVVSLCTRIGEVVSSASCLGSNLAVREQPQRRRRP